MKRRDFLKRAALASAGAATTGLVGAAVFAQNDLPETERGGTRMDETNAYEVVVVGAGAAGLSAALVLGRSRRRTLVLAGGAPRNTPSSSVHTFLSRDGDSPQELLKAGREQLLPYENVTYREVGVAEASGSDGSFGLRLEDGTDVRARKVVLATGVVDVLPDRSGFRELWGRGVYHCPYCHGWEVRDRPLAVLLDPGEGAAEFAVLLHHWSHDLAVLTNGAPLDDEARERLEALNITVYGERISRLEGKSDGSEGLSRVVFEDGSALEREGIFYHAPQRQRSELAEALGCEMEEMGEFARFVKADPLTRQTSVAGVFSAGDAGSMSQHVASAAATGVNAGVAAHQTLVAEDAESVVRSGAAGRTSA